MERISYKGWPNCYRLSNGIIDLLITADVGPRIIRLGFVGQENEFHEYAQTLGQTGGEAWCNYGGHRLWAAPEVIPRTYYPDNGPLPVEEHPGFVRTRPPIESTTGIAKEMDIHLDPNAAHVRVTHRIRNANMWAIELAPWALSVMAAQGVAILPLPPRGTHPEFLQPANTISVWKYVDLSDPRLTWCRKYVLVRQDPHASGPLKFGMLDTPGWAAYARSGHLFVVRFPYVEGARYPDLGCSVETWNDPDMLEVETLGPLTRLEPGAAVEHVEDWFLFRDVPTPARESDVDEHVVPHVMTALQH